MTIDEIYEILVSERQPILPLVQEVLNSKKLSNGIANILLMERSNKFIATREIATLFAFCILVGKYKATAELTKDLTEKIDGCA